MASCAHPRPASADLSDLHAELEMPELPDAVLRQAGPAPIELRGANLADLLSPAYPVLTTAAQARALGEVKPAPASRTAAPTPPVQGSLRR